jgi:GT2 family glycosyltransferase
VNVWIIVVNYNGLEDTRKCLRSLARQSAPASVVLVDNASRDDPCPAVRAEFPWCHLVRNPENGGWAGGNNAGIRYALERDAKLVVLLNNDTVVAPDFAERLASAARAHPGYGAIGPVIRFLEPPHDVMTDGTLFNHPHRPGFFQRKEVSLAPAAGPALTEVDIVNGCCMAVRAEVFRRVGLIDERFFLIHEESDFCLRTRRAGFRCGVLGEALVWHKGSSSFRRTGKRLQRYYDTRNLYLLLGKHTATHRPGRGPFRSLFEYLKYSYYRYVLEREGDQADAADAVLEGLCDALARRYGPFAPRPRPAVPWLRWAFETWRGRRPAQPRREGGDAHALAVP